MHALLLIERGRRFFVMHTAVFGTQLYFSLPVPEYLPSTYRVPPAALLKFFQSPAGFNDTKSASTLAHTGSHTTKSLKAKRKRGTHEDDAAHPWRSEDRSA